MKFSLRIPSSNTDIENIYSLDFDFEVALDNKEEIISMVESHNFVDIYCDTIKAVLTHHLANNNDTSSEKYMKFLEDLDAFKDRFNENIIDLAVQEDLENKKDIEKNLYSYVSKTSTTITDDFIRFMRN